MQPPPASLHVGPLPRGPFLALTEELLQYLLSFVPRPTRQVLEIGCGPRSPLLPMMQRLRPEAEFHLIDALAEAVQEATRHYPGVRVEQMRASDMGAIPSQSKQLVVAMSVYDQNPAAVAAGVAREIHRLLSDDGTVVYLHNEELNLPATAASMLQLEHPRLLLPSNSWQPTNDIEYCSGELAKIQHVLATRDSSLAPVERYLRGVLPQLYGDQLALTSAGKVAVPFLRDCGHEMMSQIRQSVAVLREKYQVALTDHRTPHLLAQLVEGRLFCAAHGFRVLRSGVFELRRCVNWRMIFSDRPPTMHLVRNVSRFGFTAGTAPPEVVEYEQELNRMPERNDEEVLLIAYQYGVVARKMRPDELT